MSDQYEFEGKSVDEAVELGLAELGLDPNQVTIDVIRKGSRGLLGFGSETALVRIQTKETNDLGLRESEPSANDGSAANQSDNGFSSVESSDAASEDFLMEEAVSGVQNEQPPAPVSETSDDESSEVRYDSQDDEPDSASDDDELTSMAIDFLEELVYLMGYDADVNATWKEPEPDETEPCLMLSVDGEDLGSLIGRRGETLDSLQYLLRLMINQKIRNWRNIVVDVGGYKEKRGNQIIQLAERMAAQVMESGRAVSLEPMPANERRMVHLALREHSDVYTESSGDRDRRKVHIIPKSLLD